MRKVFFIMLTCCILFSACRDNEKELNSIDFHNVSSVQEKSIANSYKIARIDTLLLSRDEIETSYVGHFSVFQDTLFFFDSFFGYVHRFSANGDYIDKHIGKGRGPNETLGFNYGILDTDGMFLLNSGNSSMSHFDYNFKKKKYHLIDWQIKRSAHEVLKNPIPDCGDSYEFDYGILDIFKRWDKEHFSIAITASHPKFNGYFDSSDYYNYSRIWAIVSIKTGKVTKLVGRRSPFYLSQINLPNFDHFNYEVNEDEVYYNFWADSTIYVLDKKEKVAVRKFGRQGVGMNCNYQTTQTYQEAERRFDEDITRYGFYSYLKFFEKDNMLLRGYSKGGNKNSDGIQLYYNEVLVADLEIPKGLKVIAKIGDVYYAENINEEDELIVYKVIIEKAN